MKRRILFLVLVCVMLLSALPAAAVAADTPVFTDVKDSDYFATAVRWAVSWGVTNGTSETTFSPDEICTRAQVVTFLWRAHGEPEPKGGSNPFADVPKGSYYERSTLWAVEQGITTGTSEEPKLFSPDAPCTNAEIITFIWRAKGSQAPEFPSPLTSQWPDVYYKDAVTWADNTAMLEDEGEVFDPIRFCTRGKTVAWLWREAQVYASDVDGLIKCIAPGHVIHLAPGVYNLTEWLDAAAASGGLVKMVDDLELAAALGDGIDLSPYVVLSRVLDGYELIIHDVRNLTLEATQPEGGQVSIVVAPRYANVLTFENCDTVILQNMTMGHTPEQGNCTGGVLSFRDCGRVALGAMDLYGCGTYGIIAERVDSIQTVDSVIRDCSYGLVDLTNVKDAGFGGVTFRDSSGFDMLDIRESSLSFQSCTFQNNKWDEDWCHFISLDAASSARFSACVFDKATYYDLTGERFAESDILVESSKVVE